MKLTKATTRLVLINFLFLVSFTSCVHGQWRWVRGNGNVVTQEREVSHFNSISAGNGLDVYIVQGEEEALRVEADENLMEIIVTKVKDGRLIIRTTENIRRAKAREIYVTVVNLEEIDVSSGCDFISKDKIVTKDLNIDVSSGADLKLWVEAENLSCSVSSGADAVLKGNAMSFNARSSSGSDLEATELKAKVCDARASSGGDVYVHATDEINARASSGGDVTYYGEPKKVEVHSSSGGDVRRR